MLRMKREFVNVILGRGRGGAICVSVDRAALWSCLLLAYRHQGRHELQYQGHQRQLVVN